MSIGDEWCRPPARHPSLVSDEENQIEAISGSACCRSGGRTISFLGIRDNPPTIPPSRGSCRPSSLADADGTAAISSGLRSATRARQAKRSAPDCAGPAVYFQAESGTQDGQFTSGEDRIEWPAYLGGGPSAPIMGDQREFRRGLDLRSREPFASILAVLWALFSCRAGGRYHKAKARASRVRVY